MNIRQYFSRTLRYNITHCTLLALDQNMAQYINQIKSNITNKLSPLQKNIQQLFVTRRCHEELIRIYELLGNHKSLMLHLEFQQCHFDPLKCKLKLNQGYINYHAFACVSIHCDGMLQIITKKENLHLLNSTTTLHYKSNLQKQGFLLL